MPPLLKIPIALLLSGWLFVVCLMGLAPLFASGPRRFERGEWWRTIGFYAFVFTSVAGIIYALHWLFVVPNV